MKLCHLLILSLIVSDGGDIWSGWWKHADLVNPEQNSWHIAYFIYKVTVSGQRDDVDGRRIDARDAVEGRQW